MQSSPCRKMLLVSCMSVVPWLRPNMSPLVQRTRTSTASLTPPIWSMYFNRVFTRMASLRTLVARPETGMVTPTLTAATSWWLSQAEDSNKGQAETLLRCPSRRRRCCSLLACSHCHRGRLLRSTHRRRFEQLAVVELMALRGGCFLTESHRSFSRPLTAPTRVGCSDYRRSVKSTDRTGGMSLEHEGCPMS